MSPSPLIRSSYAFADCSADTSEEAKQHSKEVLEGKGVEVEETGSSGTTGGSGSTGGSGTTRGIDDGKNPNNVAGGLKAYVKLSLL